MTKADNVEYIKGVFSTQELKKIGTGTTTRRTLQKTFWFVETNAEGILECQPVNSNYIPMGAKKTISMDELMEKFAPEPEFYMSSVFPKMQELKKDLDSGDKHREKGETFSAEHHYNSALKVDEENIRANFGIGLTYLQRQEEDKAKNIFDRLVNLEATFSREHKHLFNEFGIALRKSKMFDEAISYYEKALKLTTNDENLFLNIARVYFEKKNFQECCNYLFKVLYLNPTHENGYKFLYWMLNKQLVPVEQQEKSYTFLSRYTAALAEQG